MRLSKENKFIFLSLARTGSRSVRKMLSPYSELKIDAPLPESSSYDGLYDHISAREVKELSDSGLGYLEFFDSSFKFCFVRNPFERVISCFRLYNRIRVDNKMQLIEIEEYINQLEKRILRFREGEDKKSFLAIPLYDFSHDRDGICLLDKVYKYEEMQSSLFDIATTLNLPHEEQNIPHVGKKDSKEKFDISSGVIRKIEALYEYELNEFYPTV